MFPLILNNHVRPIMRPNSLPLGVNVGLTGGIGSGKSIVAQLLVEQGAALVDLDAIAHDLTAAGGRAMTLIEGAFGRQVVSDDGALNRRAMRDLVFNDAHNKARLEAIIRQLNLRIRWPEMPRCACCMTFLFWHAVRSGYSCWTGLLLLTVRKRFADSAFVPEVLT